MCGIAGMWGEVNPPVLQQMIDQIAHRGPDGEGIHIQSNTGMLGHRRLAIMDPAGGAQPIYNENQAAAIVANGEIYNFPQLRPALARRHDFATTSDSEAILHLFEEQDASAAAKLRGMFAFAVADEERLFLARDPIGIKPLYYGKRRNGREGDHFYFASELKALIDHVDEVAEFPAGTYYDSRRGFVPYYRVPDAPPRERPLDEVLREVRQGLEDAVVSHLMSDVPVGAFLSGGLDSSLIAAIARRHVRELHTFAVGVEGSSDLLAARHVADYIGSIHHEYAFTPEEALELLPEIIYYLESFDQDLVRSAIPCYFCARLAADYVKVILTGEGADELFAGYQYYKSYADPAALHQELHRSVSTLHNLNLQRVDRLTMCHGIEGRVPFLDTHFIQLGMSIPTELKLKAGRSGQRVEKWVLRQACEDLLPPEIVWRGKEKFGEGSGTIAMLQTALEPLLNDIDLAAYQAKVGEPLRTAEEAYYHKLLAEAYSRPDLILRNVGRNLPPLAPADKG
ncbi:MAG: asparagine synthase B [Chloroflexi bacterium]|nr:MAG: asparagine synthase B [Chloroflexota bacterium]